MSTRDASTDTLRAHIEHLAGTIGERNVHCPRKLHAAAHYLTHQWSLQGYPVERQAYEVGGVVCENLEVTRLGTTRRSEIILLGAHYDTVPGSPGANDNGTGIAALLELSRLFATFDPNLTLRFVAFVNEEAPFFTNRTQGSMVYAQAARRRRDDIRLMASLETIGSYFDAPGTQTYPPLFNLFYPDRGNFIGFVSNFRSGKAMRRLAEAFRAHSDFPLETVATFGFVPGVGWSDHRSFWYEGYPALMITDTAHHRYPHYHLPSDTPDKIAFPELTRVTSGLFAAFADLAQNGVGRRPRTRDVA
jgi:Zn-dependent M28 family amino/carboxypeptidase